MGKYGTWWLFSDKLTYQHNKDTPCASWLLGCPSHNSSFSPRVVYVRVPRPPSAAIDYDGYVTMNTTQNYINGALMKQVLGTIVGTCQTVTTQNHKDSALVKRVPGDIYRGSAVRQTPPLRNDHRSRRGRHLYYCLDWKRRSGKRQWCRVPCRALWLKVFCQKREAFTTDTITNAISKYPKFNWVVICHSPYSVGFDGVQGMDWDYSHHELPISFGRTIGSALLTYLAIFLFSFSSHSVLNRYVFFGGKVWNIL